MIPNFLSSLGFNMLNSGMMQFIAGFGVAFLLMLFAGDGFIAAMKKFQGKGQPIRTDGVKAHFAKAGTPTMGGILIIAATIISSVLFMDLSSPIPYIALAALVAFGAIGFADDLGKVKKSNAYSGLSPRARLIVEGFIAVALAFAIDATMPAYVPGTSLFLPFQTILPLGIFYFVFAYFVIAGTANAANITDGLDGMFSKIFLTVMFVMMVALVSITRMDFMMMAPYLPDNAALFPLFGAAMGAALGFLWFNSAPAQIFMGDTGSLALGGFLGTSAMLMKSEIIMGVASLMMVAILASSFLQIYYYKFTGGKRLFKMAPLHHHFELSGWAESKVSERFWIITILCAGLALALLRG
ncbi:MAG: phospho-N-acetylmuramoyl-pentapeptide-transferase [Rickettsiales bacterium]|jgi:phospho-N-acetylmuramoyl-pentapeptide-transferase|nr:phospho-N-acetylmuramoyl-pentapeptide-transferase [Rickettsiales bacterium]